MLRRAVWTLAKSAAMQSVRLIPALGVRRFADEDVLNEKKQVPPDPAKEAIKQALVAKIKQVNSSPVILS